MDWRGRRRSENVEDRRRLVGPRGLVGGGIGTVVLAGLFLFMGGDPMVLLQMLDSGSGVSNEQPQIITLENDEQAEFVSVVLAETEVVWQQLFQEQGLQYSEPTLVLFSGQAQSACGFASAAVGPFYCPGDGKVYIDLVFFEELRDKFEAPGDFAQAYVIAHEIGHHVQQLLGISDKVHAARERVSETEYNQLSVMLELQADYFAGVWAHHAQRTREILEEGDVEEGIRAASAVGDDRLQRQNQGYVVPDSFTHGTSEQRKRWFLKGFKSGDMNSGDTFAAEEL
jgi:uncharacterized protein